MKKQLKQHIELLREADSIELLGFEEFINKSMLILNEYECTFRYLRSDSKRNGHIKAQINRKTGEYTLELAINRLDNTGGQVYTIIHELTHLINNHMFSRELSKKQAEVVADTTALYFVNKYNLLEEYLDSHVASKWNVETYSDVYIDSMQLSKKRYDLIIRQIIDSKIIIHKLYMN